MITLDHRFAERIASRLGVKRVAVIDTANGRSTGFKVASNRKDVWWEFWMGRPNARGQLTLDAWKYASINGRPEATINWTMPIEGRVSAASVAETAQRIRGAQSRYEAGHEPNWTHVFAGEEVEKEWKRSH